jgi:hypothetical protein
MCEVTLALVGDLIRAGQVDADRVYAAGVSSGAAATWQIVMMQPDVFAAAAPFSSTGVDHGQLVKMVDVPIWAFNNDADQASSSRDVQRAVDALNHLGGRAHLTVLQGSDHDAWTSAFREHDLLDWLLDQRRGDPGRAPGAYRLRRYVAIAATGWTLSEAILQVTAVYLGVLLVGGRLRSFTTGAAGFLLVVLALSLLWQLSGTTPWGMLTYLDVRTWNWLDDLWYAIADLVASQSAALILANAALLALLILWRSRRKTTLLRGACETHAEVTDGRYAR